jgi:hypothetical protein
MDENYYRKRAGRRIIILLVGLLAVAGGLWYFSHSSLPKQIASFEDEAIKNATKQIVTDISNPPPLVVKGAPVGANPGEYVLTRAGVVSETNVQRKENGNLPALTENAQLDTIALFRLQDMFAKQYFAHVSPSSSSAVTVAKTVGYQYIALGENLALGNFKGDNGVLVAWMGSPGHRANILNTHYTEIGVAVKEGIFDGEDTWIAVQIFGRPASDCPQPDPALKATIDARQVQITAMLATLQEQKANLTTMQQDNYPGYNDAVTAYNNLVEQYNALVGQQKQDVGQYNALVAIYDQCIAK